jgi:hypothetical protein
MHNRFNSEETKRYSSDDDNVLRMSKCWGIFGRLPSTIVEC